LPFNGDDGEVIVEVGAFQVSNDTGHQSLDHLVQGHAHSLRKIFAKTLPTEFLPPRITRFPQAVSKEQ
jgi:hypothetical protein